MRDIQPSQAKEEGAQCAEEQRGEGRGKARRILICPNAFKGSLTAGEAAEAIRAGMARGMPPTTQLRTLPLADGGDGILTTLVQATGGTLHHARVRGPFGQAVEAAWGRLGGARQDTAVIEMAEAAGIRLLRPDEYDPRAATTQGVGDLMRAALDSGCRALLVGIGGSATNDGGAGMAQALGARLLDAAGDELPPGGAALSRLARIDLSGWRLPPEVPVRVACDVDNPLCGPNGASAIYGPQKGADAPMTRELDAVLGRYADVLADQTGRDARDVPGAGAAGGMGLGLLALCGATLLPGAELVLDMTDFDAMLAGCELAVTGEGRLDAQTARGKVVAGVARRARQAGVPVVALAGSVEAGAEAALRAEGLSAALSIVSTPTLLEDAMRDAPRLLAEAGERLARLLALWAGG